MEVAANYKVVVVGDVGVGKTSLLVTHTTRMFPDRISTVVDTFESQLGYEDKLYALDLYDTAGSESHAELRPLCYANTDVFIMCFSIVSEKSFRACLDFWKKEIDENVDEDPKIILVGLKEDLRRSKREKFKVSEEQAADMMKILGARECFFASALDNVNVDEIFLAAIRVAANLYKPPRKSLETCKLQ